MGFRAGRRGCRGWLRAGCRLAAGGIFAVEGRLECGGGEASPGAGYSPHFPKSPSTTPTASFDPGGRRRLLSPHSRRAGKARPCCGAAVRSRPWRRTEEDRGALRLVRQTARVRSRPRRLPARRLLHVRPQPGGMLQRRDHGGGRRAPSSGRSVHLWVNERAVHKHRPGAGEMLLTAGGAGSASVTPAPPQTGCAGGRCC